MSSNRPPWGGIAIHLDDYPFLAHMAGIEASRPGLAANSDPHFNMF